MFHQHYTMQKKLWTQCKKNWTKKILVENLHAAYTYPLHYVYMSDELKLYNDANDNFLNQNLS